MVSRSGFSLAEVIVAMMLLSIVAVGVASSGMAAAQMFTRAEQHERILREAEAALDSLLALQSNGAGSKQVLHARLVWSASDSLGAVNVYAHLPTRTIQLTGER